MGCSKRELSTDVQMTMENITNHIVTHATDVNKFITDLYVLHFHPECGENSIRRCENAFS